MIRLQLYDVDPVARLETFRALKLSRSNHFKALKPKDPKEVFSQRVVIRRKSLQQAYYSSTIVLTLYIQYKNYFHTHTVSSCEAKVNFVWLFKVRLKLEECVQNKNKNILT